MAEENGTEQSPTCHESMPPSQQQNKRHVDQAVDEFHTGRHLIIKHLPHDISEEEVRAALEERGVCIREVEFNGFTHTARVHLQRGVDFFERFNREEFRFSVRGEEMNTIVSSSEGILCVAHLPLIYSEHDFDNLVQMCGPVVRCFLMRSSKSGASKGYGFVEYASKASALQARDLLDSKEIGTCRLRCDWLDPSRVTYKSLHSKCLFVDHLPPEFRDVDELRRVFSVVVKPIYCQVVLKNNCPTGIGLVEFDSAEDAEETHSRLNGYSLEKRKIRVSFCIPGVHAMTICNKLVNDPNVTSSKRPLLPDPQSPLHSPLLALQNGAQFFHNLQCSLLAGQLHKGASLGLLATPHAPPPPPVPPPINNNAQMQAAMMLLLAAQAQQNGQNGHQPSILGTPQPPRNNNTSVVVNGDNGCINETTCHNNSNNTRRPLLPNPPTQRKGLLPTPEPNKRNWDNDGGYWKSPLLGDRPKGFYETNTRSPLLGDRPPPPSSLSPTSSVSSLASDATDSSTNTSPNKLDAISTRDLEMMASNNNPLMTLLLQAARQSNNNHHHNTALLNSSVDGATTNDGSRRQSLLGDFPGALQLLLPVGSGMQSKRKLHEATYGGHKSREIDAEYKRMRK